MVCSEKSAFPHLAWVANANATQDMQLVGNSAQHEAKRLRACCGVAPWAAVERHGSAAVQEYMTVHVSAPEAVTLQLCCSLPQLAGPCQPQLGRCKQLRILPGNLQLTGGQ